MEKHFARIMADMRFIITHHSSPAPCVTVDKVPESHIVNMSARMEEHFSWLVKELDSVVLAISVGAIKDNVILTDSNLLSPLADLPIRPSHGRTEETPRSPERPWPL